MENTKLEICKKCWGTGHIHGGDENSSWSKTCEDCHGIGFIRVAKTNADRIRAMSDEELANFVASKIVNIENHKMLEQGHTPTATQLSALGATMHDILIMWLKQPAEEEKTVTEGHR